MNFAVDGERLWEILQRSTRGDLADDLVPVLTFEWPVDRALRALLGTGEPDVADGRVSLYICPACGDLGCGGITAVVDRDSESVVWRDLALQNNYEPLDDDSRFVGVGPLRFDRIEYEATLGGFRGGPSAQSYESRVEVERGRDGKKWSRFRLFGRTGRTRTAAASDSGPSTNAHSTSTES